MDMLDQYLAAVAGQLPHDSRDDIVAELRDTLLSQIEEREGSLGRPLTDAEREHMLRSMGHPLAVATRYRSGPQSLIGPELYPYWLFAAKAGLAIVAAVSALNLVARLASGSADVVEALSQVIASLIGSGLGLIGCITLIGAACEHFGIRPRYLDEWTVKDLGVLRLGEPSNWLTAAAGLHARWPMRSRIGRRSRRISGSSALGSLVAGVLFVLWWVGAVRFPAFISLDHGAAPATVVPASIWTTLYLPILVYALAQIGVDALGVVRPAAGRLLALLQVPVALAGLALTWTIFHAGDWFTLIGSNGERAVVRGGASLLSSAAWAGLDNNGHHLSNIAADLSVIVSWTLVAVAAGLAIKIVAAGWRAVSGKSQDRRL